MDQQAAKEALKRYPGLREKARACQNREEILELMQNEGVELSDEQLELLSGGRWEDIVAFFCLCPNCDAWDVEYVGGSVPYHCTRCDTNFY